MYVCILHKQKKEVSVGAYCISTTESFLQPWAVKRLQTAEHQLVASSVGADFTSAS